MVQQIINIGSAPGDNTGDPARNAFDKCNLNFTELYGRSASVSGFAEYKYDTTTTPPPTSGEIRANNASVSAVTVLYFNNVTSNGSDIKRVLTEMSVGTVMVIQDQDNNVNFGKFTVSATPIDQTTYVQFPVTVSDSGGTLFNNARLLVAVMGGGGAGGGGNVSNVGTPSANQLAQWTDATHIQGITGTQTTTLLDVFTSLLKGVAPPSGGGTANFLRADGTWTAPPSGAAPAVPTRQIFTSGSGTYTTPANCRQIEVTLVGGGAGGGGGNNASLSTAGGNTTFGTSLLTANGGGTANASVSGAGGTTTVGGGVASSIVYAGGNGSFALPGIGGVQAACGGQGGFNPLAGPGIGISGAAGTNAIANSGAGGSGGGTSDTTIRPGNGGGAGGYINAVINSPAATYSYAIGSGGSGAAAGTNGYAGGNGASGMIIVKEIY